MKRSDIILENVSWPGMSEQELRALGMDEVAYIRPYKVNNRVAWVLHAADGSAITMQGEASAALRAAADHDLDLATLH